MLSPFHDIINLVDCRLRRDTHLLQDRHKLRAEGIQLGLTLEDIYHLQVLFVAIADMVKLSIGYPLSNLRQSADDLLVLRGRRTFYLKSRNYSHIFLLLDRLG